MSAAWRTRPVCGHRVPVGSKAVADLPQRQNPSSMLPGFRFLFAAIILSMSILIFGLGAAALLRAAHEEFASIPSRRAAPETIFAQQPGKLLGRCWLCSASNRRRRRRARRTGPLLSQRRQSLYPLPLGTG